MPPSRGADAGSAYSFTYAPEEPHQYRVRQVRPARQVAVARTAVRVGRVRQARERTLEVEEKDAVARRVEAGETRRSRQHLARGIVSQRDLKFQGIFQNDDEGNKKHARYVYAKECDGCFSPELACYWASLSFHGEGAPSFHQWVLISRLALELL